MKRQIDGEGDFVQETNDVINMIGDLTEGVGRMGWTALIPAIPLVGLIVFVAYTLSK